MALDVNLSLNDFRSVLGRVNDGNVVLTQNKEGIEKANYGNKFLNLFRSVRVAPNNPQENFTVRQALLTAIRNSSEGKVISASDMERIHLALGIPEGIEAPQNSQPLTRRQLKAVIDIIDNATSNDALIQKDIATLESKGLHDKFVSNGVKNAMAEAKCFNLANDAKLRKAQVTALFGADFKGRSPAEVEKFVRLNMSTIREQVFDRLYWEHPELTDFHAKEVTDDEALLNQGYREVGENEAADVSSDEVTAMFKKVVGELMEKAASKTRVATKVETLATPQKSVFLADEGAKSVWDNIVKGDDITDKVYDIFSAAPESSTPIFASLQISRAAHTIDDMIRGTFNDCYTQNGCNAQETEKAFNAKMQPLKTLLDGIAADMKRIGPDAAGKVMAKFADAFSEKIQDSISERILNNTAPDNLAETALKTLMDVCRDFSTYSIVESFVNTNYGFLADKEPVIAFFMDKIASAGKDGGIDKEQLRALSDAQNAAVASGMGPEEKMNLETKLLNPLKNAYAEKLAKADPAKVREMRIERNKTTFDNLLIATPGSNKMNDAQKTDALIKLKLNTFFAKFGNDKAFELGIISQAGSMSIKTTDDKPDPAALETLNEELLKFDDQDMEFFSQYVSKGLNRIDETTKIYCDQLKVNAPDAIFRDALRDGTISVSMLPRNAVPLLKSLVDAQIFSSASESTFTAALRDMIPKEMRSSPMEVALYNKLQKSFIDSGVKPIPKCFKPDLDEGDNIGRHLNANNKGELTEVRGFGTLDPARLLKLFAEMGIDLAALDGDDDNAKVAVFEKAIALSTIVQMSSCKLDGLPEFTERVFGKPFKDVTMTDVFKKMGDNNLLTAYGNVKPEMAVKDPLDSLKDANKTAKQLFSGEVALSEAKLSPAEATKLLQTVRSMASAAPGTVAGGLAINGAKVELKVLSGGALSVKVGNLPMRAAFDVAGLTRMIENEIVSKPNSFQKDVVTSTLPSLDDIKSGAVSLIRARELFSKVAANKTGMLPVMFSAYSTAELREIALKAVDGKFTAKDLPKNPPATYNSGAMIEMHANYAKTSSAVIDATVKVATAAPRSIDERRAVPPDGATVRNIVADFFLNKDTWEFDAGASGNAKPGERIRKLLVEHGPEMGFILDGLGKQDGDKLAFLPENVRNAVMDVFADIRELDIQSLSIAKDVSEDVRAQLAAIEAKIDDAASRLVDEMQGKVTQLFAPKGGGEVRQDWQKTFAELNGKEGIDETTRQGKFTMNVLRNYFKLSAPVDKRAMLSSFIRNTGPDSTDAKQVAELLKGAGPLLQKMLQGLPLSSFDKDTQLALKDMKSRLLPIPDEAVKAQLLELVRSSGGNIRSIEVKRSLGAASVGQAFLCTVKTKDHPNIGEECVIKLLRPNVDTAVQREKAIIDQIIGNDPAMKATFDGQYRKILEEFDLTLESTNIGIGTSVYEKPKGVNYVHSMELLQGSQATTTSMILKKADGSTFDGIIDKARGDVEDLLAPLRQQTNVDGVTKTVFKAQDPKTVGQTRRKILLQVAQLNERRNQILGVAKAWFENALFGNGFFHGDLHGGNIMTGPSGSTFIDFGNCSRLSDKDQAAMKMMLATVVSGDVDHSVSNFKKLMGPEATAVFNQKFPADSDAMKRLTDVLKRGSSKDLMSRIHAFLSIVQGEDVPVPASIQNFVQSYVRLTAIAEDIDRSVEDFKIAANSIYCDVPGSEPVEGESKAISLLKGLVRAYIGNANSPYSAEAVRDVANEFEAYAKTEDGKKEISALTHNPDRIRNELVPLLNVVNSLRLYTRFDTNIDDAGVSVPNGLRQFRNAIEDFDRLDKAGKIGNDGTVNSANDSDKEVFKNLEENFLNGMKWASEDITRMMDTVDEDGESTFQNIAVKRDKSITDICVDVIDSHEKELYLPAFTEFGFDAGGFASRLTDAYNDGLERTARTKNAAPALAERNRALPSGERLSGQEMATLSRATSDFLVPSPRPDEKKGWGAVKESRTTMLTAIAYNISRAESAMKLEPGAKLSSHAVNHAVLNMGLIDGKLIESIASMKEDDYNMLLAEAMQMDQANGNSYLSTAIDTLHGAQELLVSVTPVEEE